MTRVDELELKFDNLLSVTHYKLNGKSSWNLMENWMHFFIEIGKFFQDSPDGNLIISYIDEELPAYFLSLGVVLQSYDNYMNKEEDLDNYFLDYVSSNKTILIDMQEFGWRKGSIIGIERIESLSEKFNPYLTILVDIPGQSEVKERVPRTLWEERLRVPKNYKNTAGSKVIFSEYIDYTIRSRYGDKISRKLLTNNECFVNLIGREISVKFENFIEKMELKFYDNSGTTIDKLIYISGKENNFSNLNIYKSQGDENINEAINIYVGATAGLANYNLGNKNIYLLNRKKINTENNYLLVDNLLKSSNQQQEMTSDIENYLKNKGLDVPRGL